MNSLELMKLNKSRMNFVVEKLCNTNKDIKVAIHKNNSVYSIDKNKNVFKIISETNKSAVGSEEIFDTLNSKQLVNLFDNKYKLIIPNKLNNTLTCVAANHLTTEKIGNQNVSNTPNDFETKFELNHKTDEFVSVKIGQRSKLDITGYKIFEDSVKNLGVKIIDVLQSIINPNIKQTTSNSVTEVSSPNELKTVARETIEDKNIKKNTKVTNCTNKLLFKIGDMLISLQAVGLKYTSDGENWSDVVGEINSKSIKLLFNFSDKIMAWCTDNSFYYSSNGINWTKIDDSNNYIKSNTNIEDIKILENAILILSDGDLYYITNSYSILQFDQYSYCLDADRITKCNINNVNKISKNAFCYSIDHYYIDNEWIRDNYNSGITPKPINGDLGNGVIVR